MTEIMPVPRNLILLSYQQGASTVPVLFLVANWGIYGYICLWLPGVEVTGKTVVATSYVSPSSALRLPGVEGADETVAASLFQRRFDAATNTHIA